MTFSVAAVERFFKVLGDDNRLRILQALGTVERSVSEILERTRLPQTLASFHLRILREAGVVVTERRGPFVYYRLADVSLLNLLEACGKYAETLASPKAAADFRWPPWAMMCRMRGAGRR
jgi:DNA-binding transcriptional ArsR family regulator